MEIWFFLANIPRKYTSLQKPESRIHEFVQMTLNYIQSTIFHAKYCEEWIFAVE